MKPTFEEAVAKVHRTRFSAELGPLLVFGLSVLMIGIAMAHRNQTPSYPDRCRAAGGTYAEMGGHDVCLSRAITIPMEGGR